MAYWVVIAERIKAQKHLKFVFPDKDDRWVRETIKQVFANFGKSFFEVFHLKELFDGMDGKGKFADYIEVEGEHHFSEQLEKGRGALFITGHCGNWELLAALVVKLGFPLRPIVRRLYDQRLDDLLNEHRIRHGYPPITRTGKEMVSDVQAVFEGNGILGILIDQDTKVRGVFAPFLGYPAHTPSGPAYLAYKMDMDVIVGLIRRNSNGGHKATILPPIKRPCSGDEKADLVEYTEKMNDVIGEHIRNFPAEWVWMHRRWKTRPEGEHPKDNPLMVNRKEKFWWAAMHRFANAIFSRLSWKASDCLGIVFGSVAAFFHFRKNTAIQNMKLLSSGKHNEKNKNKLYRSSCRSVARNLVRNFNSAQMDEKYFEQYFQIENLDIFENEMRARKGALLLGANIGSLEGIFFRIAAMGYGITLVCETKDPAFYDRWVHWSRRRGQIFTVSKDADFEEILKAYEKTSCMAFLVDDAKNIKPNIPGTADQRIGGIASKIAAVSYATGAPIIQAYSLWEKGGKQRAVFDRKLPLPQTNSSDDYEQAVTLKILEAFDRIIDACPRQYNWIKTPKYH